MSLAANCLDLNWEFAKIDLAKLNSERQLYSLGCSTGCLRDDVEI